MTRDITPDEKWHRLKSPKTADDYAVRMTAEEVSKVPEAAQALSQFMPYIVSVYRSGARREFYGVCVTLDSRDVMGDDAWLWRFTTSGVSHFSGRPAVTRVRNRNG